MTQLCRILMTAKTAQAPLPLTLLFSQEAYRIKQYQLLGQQSAGTGFLEAYLRHGQNNNHQPVVYDDAEAA